MIKLQAKDKITKVMKRYSHSLLIVSLLVISSGCGKNPVQSIPLSDLSTVSESVLRADTATLNSYENDLAEFGLKFEASARHQDGNVTKVYRWSKVNTDQYAGHGSPARLLSV